MPYSYSQITLHAAEVGRCLGYLNLDMGKAHSNWDSVVAEVEGTRKNANALGASYVLFLMALARAKYYVEHNQGLFAEFNSAARHKYLDHYIEWSINTCKELKSREPGRFSAINLERFRNNAPTPTSTSAIATAATAETTDTQPSNFFASLLNSGAKVVVKAIRDDKVDQFINSEAFKRLVSYQKNVLTGDIRSHSYFFKSINLTVNKADLLKRFINKLQTAIDMQQLNTIFSDLYLGRGEFQGVYDTLNRGQNITTLLLANFGLKTTTATLIDELREFKDSLQSTFVYNSNQYYR